MDEKPWQTPLNKRWGKERTRVHGNQQKNLQNCNIIIIVGEGAIAMLKHQSQIRQ